MELKSEKRCFTSHFGSKTSRFFCTFHTHAGVQFYITALRREVQIQQHFHLITHLRSTHKGVLTYFAWFTVFLWPLDVYRLNRISTLIFLELRWPHMVACVIVPTFDPSRPLISQSKRKHLCSSVRPLSRWFKPKCYEPIVSACLHFLCSKQETTDLWVDSSGVTISITEEKQLNNSRVTICQNYQLTGTVCSSVCALASYFLCFTRRSHTSQISKCCFFCTSWSVTSGKKKKLERKNLTKKWFMLVPALFLLLSLRGLCLKWTVNRNVTWLMSSFDCDPRYSHNGL